MLTRLLPCAQVATYTLDAAGYDVAYTYTYDDNGNITSISDGSNTTSYVYDSANQLIRENNQALGFTHVWEYDNAGNILSRTEYAYTTGNLEGVTPTDTVTYTYGDSNWGDLLTAYDGNTVTYDQIGNPLTDGTWTYTWEHGRELASMTDGTTTWSHTYNADGLRTQRTNGTTTYSYVYNGGSLRQLTRGSDTLYISYDASGAPMSLSYNGTLYYYATNLQGDITAILNTAGTAVVSYTYDAWGNILATEGTMKDTLGTLNPLRYRGYVYDQETGLYYLQSRYYNPEIGRFISIDNPSNLGRDGALFNNLYAYCANNPVTGYDPTGCWNWGVFADAATTIGAAFTAICVGLNIGVSTFVKTGSVKKAYSTGITAAAVTFGTINNTVNAVYYNHISDGVADIETNPDHSTYVDEYVTRWDRLDYTKQETGEESYNFDAWSFHSEYSLHMYGWYATSWAKNTSTPLFSSFAGSFYFADVDPHVLDERPHVKIGTLIWGVFGL